MMKLTFDIDAYNKIECYWSSISGLEVYKHNNKEVFRTRSFKMSGSSQFAVTIDGQEKILRLQLKFCPSFNNIFKSTGFIVQAYLDDELLINNLLTIPYWHKNKLIKILDNVAFVFAFLVLIVFIAATFFSTELFPQAESVKVINAALATPECLASYHERDKSLMLPEHIAVKLRAEEMSREHVWVTSGGRSVFAIITSDYGTSSIACQQSRLELFDQYLANGANINTVRSNFKQLTVLQDAVMMIDLPLICELLERGASTDVRVIAHHHDGSASKITGLTTYELPGFLGKKMNDPIYRKVVSMFDDYNATNKCKI